MMKTNISALLIVLLVAAQMTGAQESVNEANVQSVASTDAKSSDQVPASEEADTLSWLFEKGLAQYKAGNYDEAAMMFDGMLAIDKYNADAMLYKKRAAKRGASAEVRARDTSQAKAMAAIDAAWNPEPKVLGSIDVSEAAVAADPGQQVIARLKAITIPSLDFADASIEEVMRFFAEASRNQGGEDVDFLIIGVASAMGNNHVTISVSDMSLYEALQYVVEMAALKFEIKPNLVVIMPANYVPAAAMVAKSYDVIPEVGVDLESVADSGGGEEDLFGGSSSAEASTEPVDVAGFFSIVDFPEGASAIYQPRFKKLFVQNTSANLQAIEAVLADLAEEAIKQRSQQVMIEAKFVEFSEGALEELGFDWNVYGSGTAAGMELDPREFGRYGGGNDPNTGQEIFSDDDVNNVAGGGRPGQNIFGSTQRDNTTGLETIQSGLLGLMGGPPATMMFGNGDIDLQIAAMEQEGTADMLSAPTVTTKSGVEAVIRIAETHRYPQDYEVTTGQRTAPVMRPQDWEDFDVGVSLKVTPEIDAESSAIDLDLNLQRMGLAGVDKYLVGYDAYNLGSSLTGSPAGSGAPLEVEMRSFDVRFVQTSVAVADGHTVVLGGLIDERTETFRDQVPILGDIPYLGRLFRTEGSRSAKRNLTIFVKASLVDARGMTRADRAAQQAAVN